MLTSILYILIVAAGVVFIVGIVTLETLINKRYDLKMGNEDKGIDDDDS